MGGALEVHQEFFLMSMRCFDFRKAYIWQLRTIFYNSMSDKMLVIIHFKAF